MDICAYVKQIIEKHKTNNPFEIAKEKNIIVIFEKLAKIRGYYEYNKRCKYIHINEDLPSEEQHLVCAHELGHALLHPKVNIIFITSNTLFVKNKFEIEANKFAAELLIQDDLLHNYEGLSIEQIAVAENLNMELLKLKFDLGCF
ncbi:putative Zn peptidase [Clostridium aceticum]|uniref:Putative Zn peptidase n=1 Tax=Clostridium aceticum TaxID=84022 RepID=A0A0D8IC94_9CLOT|nr:ImmA/IrrE family metallo-endopeptidase [Clostridium aceticum]AKL94979.1 putative Zn peptidase [Clostridium aceticum]KJF27888.1 hypothetical protein TZ02_04725 [Clostridium aceticum]